MRAIILAVALLGAAAQAEEPTEPCLNERATAYLRLYELRAAENRHAKATQGAPADAKEAARGEVKQAARALIEAADAYKACLTVVWEEPVRIPTECHSVPGDGYLWQCDACEEIRSTGVRVVPGACKEPTP